MCQGSVPEYFVFKQSPPELPPRSLTSRFLVQSEEHDPHTLKKEYSVSKTAPCPIIDAHVHVFPQKLMDAVWSFFDSFYWPVRYKGTYLTSRADFLIEHGVQHVVLLVHLLLPTSVNHYRYAHKNGIARDLNKFLAATVDDMNRRYSSKQTDVSRPRQRVASGLATVMPGEPGAKDILAEAFTTLRLSGIKMHSHVQCVPANHSSMDEVYDTCVRFDKPVLIHAGKEPNSSAYKVDAGKICDVSIVEDVLTRYPNLRICVPHLGMNQYQEFFDLLDRFPNLYLDTTMTLASFFQSMEDDKPLAQMMRIMIIKHSDRILYGTDWPNIPYDWSRELANLIGLIDGDGEATSDKTAQGDERGLKRTVEGDNALERILWRNASAFYGITESDIGYNSRNQSML